MQTLDHYLAQFRLRLLGLEGRWYERRWNIHTRGNADLEQFDLPVELQQHGFPYVPTPYRLIWQLLDEVQHPIETSRFVDFGSGKGRVVFAAATRPFLEAIGIEFANGLHQQAIANRDRFAVQGLAIAPMRFVHGDAGAWRFPSGDLVLHFNNPFAEPVMQRLLDNLRSSSEQQPRQITLFYHQLADHLENDRSENLKLLRDSGLFAERSFRSRGILNRWLFASHHIRIFTSTD